MNIVAKLSRPLILMTLFALAAIVAQAQTSTITYQGRLTDAGPPATGSYDFEFKVFTTQTVGTGTQRGSTIPKDNVNVASGIFTVQLDFGATVFTGENLFLEIGVRPGVSVGAYTTLAPRQQFTSTPYAIHSLASANLGTFTSGATPSVTNLTVLVLNYSSSTTITNLTGGINGQCVALINIPSAFFVSINNGGSFSLNSNWNATSNDTLTLCYYNSTWYETSRKFPPSAGPILALSNEPWSQR